MIALMSSGEASASTMPSSPSSVRIRTNATSWQLAVFCWTDSTRRIWQMIWVIFTGRRGIGVMGCWGGSVKELSQRWTVGIMASSHDFDAVHWDHEPTPNPSQEGNWHDANECFLHSWERAGVGRFTERWLR